MDTVSARCLVVFVYSDLKKAFGKVDRKKLITKLENFGTGDPLSSWLFSCY